MIRMYKTRGYHYNAGGSGEQTNSNTAKLESNRRDGVQGVWIKNLTSLVSRIAEQLDRVFDGREMIPQGKIPLIVLDQYTAFPLCGSY